MCPLGLLGSWRGFVVRESEGQLMRASSLSSRDDFFVAIHKALRSGLLTLGIEAGRIDWGDAAQVDKFRERWERVMTLVRSHAGHEERHIWSLLESKYPGVVAELGVGHDAIEAELDAVEALFQAVLAGPCPKRGLSFYRALNRTLAHTLEHFAAEEPALMELLWSRCTDNELAACRAAFMSEIPPQEAGWTFELMVEALTDQEQVEVLHGLQASMPPPVFDAWLDNVERSLPPKALAAMRRLVQRPGSAA
jgi:hypothetical protein